MQKAVPAPHRAGGTGGSVPLQPFAGPAVVGDGEIGRRPLGPAGRAILGIVVDRAAGAATNADKRTGDWHLPAKLAGRDDSVNRDATRLEAL
ncbi:MAG: hypothetical protein OJF58_001310 [Enhydrobacter sp.]|nr:MAG: hypothetical protein OJF58_001310 [Enhydrobacter sp.]